MSSVSSDSSLNHTRIRRKPAPSLEVETRYPTPDPDDPFAPLSVLRSRTASTLSNAAAPLSFRGESTSHLPSLPYTGGRYPPDIYQTCLDLDPLPPGATPTPSDRNLDFVTTSFPRSSSLDIVDSPTTVGCQPDESIWLPRDYAPQYSRPVPIQRRRSRSAVSRKEARLTVPIPPKNSPYGHSKLQSYVLANVLSSTPAFTAEPLSISPTSSIGQSSESVHSFFSRVQSDTSCPAPSSPLRLASFSADDHVAALSKAKKFARLLPKKIGSRLSLTHQSTDNLALSQTNASYTSFHHLPTERPSSKPNHVSEENTFHARRKSTTLFPAEMATRLHTIDVSNPIRDSTTGYVYEPLTDAELGLTGGHGVSPPPSQDSHASYSPPTATASTHLRSLTALDGRSLGPAGGSQHTYEIARPSTAQTSPSFDEHALPTPRQLADAASCFVIAENGLRIPFGDLFRDQKTIVLFIRHFWLGFLSSC
ncbi:hypothetical protein JVT61DRAFT_4372 [Boletus reticuloceps]|uniref:Uncharacterized protein n=1 Tax=Boletus reticuloceps TaxID=495285 RepID=A0A8I3A8W2_9AGAM|nr:hypothetical protein JVT61DRAFT_4372 [Boletus reticuloceps]